MSQVTISINAREYAIACEDGQEVRIIQLARILDEKARLLTNGSSQISENMLLAMVGLLLADELSELKKGNPQAENSAKINVDKLKQIDVELAEMIKTLDKKVKDIAKEVNIM